MMTGDVTDAPVERRDYTPQGVEAGIEELRRAGLPETGHDNITMET